MSLFVKICGLRDADDVAAAVAAGVQAVGFVFAESLRRVSPEEARLATRDLPADVRKVAVMRHPADSEWLAVLAGFEPDVLQTDAADFKKLDVPDHVECWPVYREGGTGFAVPDEGVFVYEGPKSGSGETVDWTLAAKFAARGRMLLAGGLAEDNVARAVRTVRPWGVDVSSGVESLPGRKDHELMQRFVTAVRAVENEL
jgi:phosphoribosylanthranilate isomerase